MIKRLISVLLAFIMIVGLGPLTALADNISNYRLNGFLGKYVDSDIAYDTNLHVTNQSTKEIAPGITGTDVCYYDVNNNQQVAGYMTKVDLSQGNVKIKATYKGFYNGTDSSKWGVDKWGMQTLTDQATAYEKSTGEKVVAATNGDYFNMQTGQPLGVLVMNGVNSNPDNTAAEPYFAILKDGSAVIRDKGTPIDDVMEGISSPFYLVKDGVNVANYNLGLIPCNSIGVDDEGNVITFLVDGRQEPYSRGMSPCELAEFWIAQGVKNVLYLDGGGSATALSTVNDGNTLSLRNSPSDGYERTVSSGLLFISTAPDYTGVFDHAIVYTMDNSYVAGALVEFRANCVDTTGHTMKTDTHWELDATSSKLGSIDELTGVFSSNGKLGKVTANLVLDGKVVASKTITVTEPDETDNYNGFICTEAGKKYMVNGEEVTGWFTIGKELYHSGSDGVVHNTTTKDTRTCLDNGRFQGTCECGEIYYGQAMWSLGHDWDKNHVCTRCGEQGVDINSVTVPKTKFYTYTGKPITPTVDFLTYEGRTLNIRSSRKGTDGYVSYYNNVDVGVAQMTVEGRGNFYSTMNIDYYIIPGPIGRMYYENVTDNSATLHWDTANGATKYMVEQNVSGTWKSIATVSGTTYALSNLKPNTRYEYRVSWEATLDKTYHTNTVSRQAVSFTTLDGKCDVNCSLENGQTVKVASVNGENYIFLPSGTDIRKIVLSEPGNSIITITGDKGSISTDSAFDINKVSSLTDGAYTVTLRTSNSICTIHIMVSNAIGSVFITSDDPEKSGRTYVDAEKGNSTTGRMLFVGADGNTVVYDGGLTQLKSRGNSSFIYSPKKAYQIKLESKSDLLGNGEKGKTWVLLSNYMDATAVHDKLFKDLASKMGMLGSPDCNWVDLYYDGEYRGTYLVSEKASIGKTTVAITSMEDAYSEVNEDYGNNAITNTSKNAYGNKFFYTEGLAEPVNITGGYLLEVNGKRGVDEASGFKTSKWFDINVKSPEYAGKAAMTYISEYFQGFEDAVYAQDAEGNYTGFNVKTGKYFYEYCDMDSLVKMYLLQSIAASPDAFYASLYFYKDKDEIMHIGPLWDMDLSMGVGMDADIGPKNNYISAYRYLAQALIQIPEFQQAVKSYYNSDFKSLIQELIDSGIDEYAGVVESSLAMNHVIWPYVRSGNPNSSTHFYDDNVTYENLISNAKTWMTSRLKYVEKNVTHAHSYNCAESTPATCTEAGKSTYTCSICQATKVIAVPALGHNYSTAVVTAPTCTEKGYTTHNCACGDSFVDKYVDALGHKTVLQNAKVATCTEPGYSGDYVCSVCGETVKKGIEIKATGHAFGDWEETTAPTCTEQGVETCHCSICDTTERRAVEALGHDAVHHDGKTASCTESGWEAYDTCSRCDNSTYKEIAALGHDYKDGKCTRCRADDPDYKSPVKENPFVDVKEGTPYYDAVLWAYYHEPQQITGGFDATHFKPGDPCTRGQVVTFLWRAAGCPEPKGDTSMFKDAASIATPYQKAVAWAVEKGITAGYNDGTFRPNESVTRAQFVTFLWRYEGKPATSGSIDGFKDAGLIASPYQQAIAWAVEKGITAGYNDGTFRPGDTCTRWAVVVFMYRDMAEKAFLF